MKKAPIVYESFDEDASIVSLLNKILLDAIKKGVSDIHFEPYEQDYRIRYRLDGILTEISAPPLHLANRITSRIKIMSNLDISERRLPQDGRFKMNAMDFRVSTCPLGTGEKVVIRILNPNNSKLSIEALGLNFIQQEQFLKAIKRPQGLILVTGPTGSGKTLTLYTALKMLNTKEVNICSAEDPIEIKLTGVNQVTINPKAGLSFANTLRTFLRQDPDIIMLGEIRDLETAQIAIKAAQTGHLVLSTLHTNSAAETISCLLNMGISSFNLANALSLIIAQRLVRKICDNCKALGCEQCIQGYRGRVALFEFMPLSIALKQLIMAGVSSLEILKQAQTEGMFTLHQTAMDMVKNGITSIEEINRLIVE